MGWLGGSSLGLSFGSRAVQASELRGGPGSSRLVRTAQFTLGEQDSLQDPVALGKKLGQFLKQNKFSARQAVIGLPAQWVMLAEKTLPPATPDAMANMLRMLAERDFSLEPSTLALDYVAGPPAEDGQASVVMIATLRERIEQLGVLARSAGLKLRAITPTALALAAAARARGSAGQTGPNLNGYGTLLYFGANGAELAAHGYNGLPRLRFLASRSAFQNGSAQSSSLQLAGELQRALGLAQQGTEGGELTVWDDLGVDSGVLSEMNSVLKVPWKNGAGLNAVTGVDWTASRAAGSTALALCQFQPALSAVDFLHSRLAVAAPSRLKSLRLLGAVAGISLLTGVGYVIVDGQQRAAAMAEKKLEVRDTKKESEAAKLFIERVKATSTWIDHRAQYLECLSALALCFPENRHVWVSQLRLTEDLRGVITGGAVDDRSSLNIYDQLRKKLPEFIDVKTLQSRKRGMQSSENAFGINFRYKGAE